VRALLACALSLPSPAPAPMATTTLTYTRVERRTSVPLTYTSVSWWRPGSGPGSIRSAPGHRHRRGTTRAAAHHGGDHQRRSGDPHHGLHGRSRQVLFGKGVRPPVTSGGAGRASLHQGISPP